MWLQSVAWARVGQPNATWIIPPLVVVSLSVVWDVGWETGVLGRPYLSPYVGAVGVVANRINLRAGLLTAFLSFLVFNTFFASKGYFGIPSPGAFTAYVTMVVLAIGVAPRPRAAEKDDAAAVVPTDLPFVSHHANAATSIHGKPISYWCVAPTGDWGKDCEIGKEYARIWLETLRTRNPPDRPLICWIFRDMVVGGKFTGIEAGFVQNLGRPGPSLQRFALEQNDLLANDKPDNGRPH